MMSPLFPGLIVLSVSVMGQVPACAAGEEIALDSPQAWQVSQRRTRTEGSIRLTGKGAVAADRWEFRLAGQGLAAVPDAWQDCTGEVKDGAFDFPVPVAAGGWYAVEVRAVKDGNAVASVRVEAVGVGEVFVIAGQSNAGNYGSEKQETKTGRVSSFDGKSWHVAHDPQRGAGGDGGSFLPAFGDAMAEKYGVPIGLVPLAAGGTSVREWLPPGVRFAQLTTTGNGVVKSGDGYESNGALFARLCQPLEMLGRGGCRAVLWHQGESDAGQARAGYPADRQITGAQYGDFMRTLIRASQDKAGWPVPWFTAVTTYHQEEDPEDTEFRGAMQRLWSDGLSLEGPDTDALRGDLRAGVHFNGRGLQAHGGLWAEKVGAWLDGQLAAPAEKAGR